MRVTILNPFRWKKNKIIIILRETIWKIIKAFRKRYFWKIFKIQRRVVFNTNIGIETLSPGPVNESVLTYVILSQFRKQIVQIEKKKKKCVLKSTNPPRNVRRLLKIIRCVLAGNIRRFRRVCEHIQTQMCLRKPPPSSPRAGRKFNADLSESSSCGSDTSDRLSPYINLRTVSWR